MKKVMKCLALPMLLLGLVACGTTNNPESNSTSSTSSSSSIVEESKWPAELKSMMNELLGEELPYIELKEGFTYSILTDEDGDFLYIGDESTTNIVEDYKAILLQNGYTYIGEEEDDYTAYFYQKGDVVVQVDYFPGTTEYLAGNEIYAWIEENGGSEEDGQTTLTAWPEELASMMNEKFNETIPFVALASNFTYYEYDDETVAITDECSTNYLENYGEVLENAGYEFLELNSDYGYDISLYGKTLNDDYNLIIQYGYAEGEGNEIYAYTQQIIHEIQSTSWPKEQIASIMNEGFTQEIPSFEAQGDYTYFFYNGGIYIYGSAEDLSDSYATALEEKGYMMATTLDWETFEEVVYYYDWEENVNISFAYDEDDGSFYVSIMPVEPAYDEMVNAFPSEAIASFLKEGATQVPAFETSETQIKLSRIDAIPALDLNEMLIIEVRDSGTVGKDSLEDTYQAVLKANGWTISLENYEDEGVIATSSKQDVKLTFFVQDGVFMLYIENVD